MLLLVRQPRAGDGSTKEPLGNTREGKPRAALLPGCGALGTARLVYGLRSKLTAQGALWTTQVCKKFTSERVSITIFSQKHQKYNITYLFCKN